MMKWIIKSLWIWKFLFVPLFLQAGISSPLEEGKELYEREDFFRAAIAFEKGYFLSDDHRERVEFMLHKAYCYKRLNDYKQVLFSLYRLDPIDIPDSLEFELRYERVLANYVVENHEKVGMEYLKLTQNVADTNLVNQAQYLYILSLNELGEWEKARTQFEQYLHKHSLSKDSMMVYDFLDDPKLFRDAEKAKKLSYLLPGLGQAYLGKPGRAVTSFLLNGAALTYAAVSFFQGYYVTAAFTGLGLFQAFYMGGARYSAHLAETINQKIIVENNFRIKRCIIELERQRMDR